MQCLGIGFNQDDAAGSHVAARRHTLQCALRKLNKPTPPCRRNSTPPPTLPHAVAPAVRSRGAAGGFGAAAAAAGPAAAAPSDLDLDYNLVDENED